MVLFWRYHMKMAPKLCGLIMVLLIGCQAIVENDISCSVDLSRKGCENPSSGLPLPVYIYPTPYQYQPQQVHPYLRHISIWLSRSKGQNAVEVHDPDEACLFLVTSPPVALCNTKRMDCGYYEYWKEFPFDSLSHWNVGGDGGMNHIIFMPSHTDWEVTSYPTGKAMLLRSASTARTFWPKVDVQMPFYAPVCNSTEGQPCAESQQVEGRGPSFLPDWVEDIVEREDKDIEASQNRNRKLLGGFIGAIRLHGPYVIPAPDLTIGNRLRVALTCLHSPHSGFVVADTNDYYDLREEFALVRDHGKLGDTWRDYYWRVLLESSYALCPSGAGAHSQRINEAIAAGSVPVVFDDDVRILPFSDHPEAVDLWDKCVIRFESVHQIEHVVEVLENHRNNKIRLPGEDIGMQGQETQWEVRRKHCRQLHKQFFSSHDHIIDSAFKSINSRIQQSTPSACTFRRPLAVELSGFNGALPDEDTPFPARERTSLLSYGRQLHPPRFALWTEAGGSVGSYQEGLFCLHRQLFDRYSDSNVENVDIREKLRRKMVVSLSLAEECAVLGQYERASLAYQQCRLGYDDYLISFGKVRQGHEWMVVVAAWCDYLSGLLSELEAQQTDDDTKASTLIATAVKYYSRALSTHSEEASRWTALRDGTIAQFAHIHDDTPTNSGSDGWAMEEDELTTLHSVEVGEQSQLAMVEKPMVRVKLDPISWLAWEFNHKHVRICLRSTCEVQIDSVFTNTKKGNKRGDLTAYLTSFGGRPDDVKLPPKKSNHVNVVVFMENDARLFKDGQRGFSLSLNQTLLSKLDLGIGYRPSAPWDDAFLQIPTIPWRRVSYINDPIENFQKWQQFDSADSRQVNKLIPGVAFFSSQCDPVMAAARLELIKPLIEALQLQNIRFASFGKCFHTEDLETSLPQCANLHRQTVDHDGSKSCVLSHFAFTLAIENSEDVGYVTEKLWQPLLAGSVPIYWGAPEVKSLLPSPISVVHIRDFEGSMSRLAAHLKYLLDNKDEYEKHRQWKRQPIQEWSPNFIKMVSNRKEKVFCAVCDYTATHAEFAEEEEMEEQASWSILGYFTLNVMTDTGLEERRIDIPDCNRDALLTYAQKVCLEVNTDQEGCNAIANEIGRLQASLREKLK